MTAFITTEQLFQEITDDATYNVIDLQLNGANQQETIDNIKKITSDAVIFQDKRQLNTDAKHTFITLAVFIYGFIGVIALISILNIINSMSTSIVTKTKYLGVMRAVGMTGSQLSRMVLSEALLYSLTGCILGSILGLELQKLLLNFLLADWNFPLVQMILIFVVYIGTASISILAPLKRIKAQGISEVIGS